MRKYLIFFLLLNVLCLADPVFRNPGIPPKENYEIWDYINKNTGYVLGKVNLTLKEEKGIKYYDVVIWENVFFTSKIKLNAEDFTTISELRIDNKNKRVIEEFGQSRNGNVHFVNLDKGISKAFYDSNRYYSRYAYLISFRGFPFGQKDEVYFQCYMNEFPAGPLTMRLRSMGIEDIKVKAGKFRCYKLELTVAGWQGAFNKDSYYFYYTVAKPNYFVKFLQKADTGRWLANELISYKSKIK